MLQDLFKFVPNYIIVTYFLYRMINT